MKERLSMWTAGAAIALALSWMPIPANAGGGATGTGGPVGHGLQGQDTTPAHLAGAD
jgi:hypothetical protein